MTADMETESMTKQKARAEAAVILGDHVVGLDTDELRNQMTAQVNATKLRFTSKASLELLFYLFVAYCSTFYQSLITFGNNW